MRHSISRLYTGSSADYERPSLHYVGTGEGSQAYGWGLYASNRRGVAESYAKAGVPRGRNLPFMRIISDNGTTRNGRGITLESVKEEAYADKNEYWSDKIAASTDNPIDARKDAKKYGREIEKYFNEHFHEYKFKYDSAPGSHLYEQTWFADRAPGDESHLLKWYEPVSEEQLTGIGDGASRLAVRKLPSGALNVGFERDGRFTPIGVEFSNGLTGEKLYGMLAKSLGSPKAASEFLARAGIDGVKYPVDSYGKAVKDGDEAGWNFVSFRDDNIRVDHKWTDGQQRYSVTRNPDARREVEDALAKDADGRYTGRANADIVFSDALPPALIACGIPDGRVYTRGYVLRKLEREHALDADGIMAVSQAMESPAAVLSDASGGGYIVLTDHETRDEDGRVAPVMVYLRPDGRGNYIASAYARSRRAESQYVNLIRAGNALFVDKRKVATLNLTGEVQSSFESARGGDAGSIPYGGTDSQGGEPVRYSVVRDGDTLAKLNGGRTIRAYRAMQLVDGRLYPPMAAKVDGKWQEPAEIGEWLQADERPDLADGRGMFKLNKGNGSTIRARYNPYWHTSLSMLNDQFSSAINRPNLVTVEVEVPEGELTSGYRAEGAKDAVGKMKWHSGPVSSRLAKQGHPREVILSRWCRVVRIVPDAEVANEVARQLNGTGIAVPENTVTPSLYAELKKRGVATIPSHGEPRHSVRRDELALHDDPQREYDEVVARFTNEDGTRKPGWMEAPNGEPTNLTERQWVQVRTPAFKRWFGDWEGDPANASKVVDENGEPLVVYHGEREGFNFRNVFLPSQMLNPDNTQAAGIYFTESRDYAEGFGGEVGAAFISIRDPYMGGRAEATDFWRESLEGKLDIQSTDDVMHEMPELPEIYRDRLHDAVSSFLDDNPGITDEELVQDYGVAADKVGDLRSLADESAVADWDWQNFVEHALDWESDFGSVTSEAFEAVNELLKADNSSPANFSRWLRGRGYDGQIAPIRGYGYNQYIVFDSRQIKSATDNAGAFDASDPDIRHSVVRGATSGVKEALRHIPDADGFVRDAVMGMLAAAGDGNGAANAGGEGARPTPERASVRRGGSPVRIDDLAIGTLAQRILAGREPTVDDAGKFLAGFGLSRTVNAADALDRARRIAEANRERLKAAVERANPEVIGTLARANLADSMQSAMDSLVRGTAQAVDPEIGMRLKDAVAARDRRALMAAKGFTAAEMMARLPVNLAEAVMSVAELGRTPGETARREEERKRREEEKAKKGENEAAAADADGYTPASDEIEPTDAQKRMVAELLDRAKFANEQAAREDERRKADAERRGAERRDGEDGDDGSDGDREGTESALPEATVRRIAPVLTDRWLAAQFLIEWIGDEILKSHPEIPATGEMWKSPVAIRELKQTAVHILRQLAKDTLGSPSLNYARNLADHQINELESDVDTRTYRMVRRRIADVYETIHDNALRISRRRLVSRLIDGWRENGVSHPGIRQLTGARGRFSATTEEMRRRIDGRTEVYARKLIPLLTMSEEKLAAREAELERIVTGSPDETTAPDEETMREARDELAALKKYGGLVRRMPGEIADAADEILTDLGGRRQAFEQRRLEREERLKRTSDTLVAAITDRTAPRRTKPKGRFARFVESYQGNIGLEIRNLFRFCRDESKREAALNETQDVEAALSEAGSVYRTERMRSQAAIGDALKACYGNAAKGIRHLTAERIPDDVAAACFGQNRGQVVTYGNLLQMYASVVQADYAENAREHGRDGQIEMMRNALTDGDVAFYAWAVGWYRDGRRTLSDAVESVTGVPVTSPGENYVPVRVSRPSEGFAADAIAWSPIPRALSRRVPHRLDFDESAIVTRKSQEMRPFSCAGNGILTIP